MASNSSMKFSVVLELLNQAFNKAARDAKDNYSATTNSITADSAKMEATSAAVSQKLKDIFNAKDSAGVTQALKAATLELNNTAKGATITADQLKQVGTAGKLSVAELSGSLRTAQAELKSLASTKATPTDITQATDKVKTLQAEVSSAKSEYGRFQTAASTAMKRASADTSEAADKAKVAGQAIYGALNIKTGGALRTEIAAITQQLTLFKSTSKAPAEETERVTKAAAERIKELRNELGGIPPVSASAASSLLSIGKGALAVAGVTAGFAAIKAGIESVVETTIKFEAVNKQLEFATGSVAKAGIEFDFVRKVSKDLGLELLSSADSYAKLTSATKGTALEGQATRDVFLGVASAAASLGLSVDDTNGVMLAISQIASKGVVSMEELRQQLGERLPPAMAIAAQSMGVTVAELGKLVENGLDSVTFLKAFGPAMITAFGPTATKNAASLQGSINGLKNELTEMLVTIGKGGLGQAVSAVLGDIAKGVGAVVVALKTMDPATVSAVTEAFQQMYGVVSGTFSLIMQTVSEALTILNDLAKGVVEVVGSFAGVDTASDKVSFLTRTLQGLGVLLGTIRDGVSALSIMLSFAQGVAEKFFSVLSLGLSKVTFGDLSASLLQFSKDMDQSASASFEKANKAALGFKSEAVGAFLRAAEAAETSGARVAAAAATSSAQATSASVAAGEAAQGSFRKTELAAQKASITANLSGKDVAEVMIGLSKTGTAVTDAFGAIAKEIGVTIPPSVRSIEDMGKVFGTLAAQSNKLASDIRTNLPEALSKLNGPELAQFRTAFVAGLEKAGASADYVQKALLDISTAGAKALGVDLAAALTTTSKGFNDNRVILDGFIKDFTRLKDGGVNSSKLIADSLQAMLDKAKNPAELTVLIQYFQTLGKEGKISGDAMAAGLTAAKAKIDALTPGVNSLAEAFKTLGLQSREEAKQLATSYATAYDTMKKSGQATTAELQQAFTKYADQAVTANKGVIESSLQVKAGMIGLKLEVDATGKVIVTSMDSAVTANAAVANSTKEVVTSYAAVGTAAERAAESAVTAAEKVIAAQQRINKVKQDTIDLENERQNVDAQGFSKDKTGKATAVGVGETWLSILNTLKGYGITDDAAARGIASKFTDLKGNVPYFNNPGQKEFGADTLSFAIQKAAQQYLLANPASKTAEAGDKGGQGTVIKFEGSDGQSASVTTNQGTTVAGVVGVLRRAGATSVRAV